jgi:hypothetical protein
VDHLTEISFDQKFVFEDYSFDRKAIQPKALLAEVLLTERLLEHIFKKMGSTEIVLSSVRLSVRPSVRPSVCDLFLGRYST